jgi:hypothetical protein
MIQVLKNTASSTQSRQIMSGCERFEDWQRLPIPEVSVFLCDGDAWVLKASRLRVFLLLLAAQRNGALKTLP